MDNPLVSIIIPTYNRAHLIGETLDSVLAQTYENWECIIVDDGSNDNTDEVIGAYVNKDGRFQFYKRPESHNSGGNGARNYGFGISKGEFVNWFDSDDIMLPDFIKLKIKSFTPAINFVIATGYNVDKNLSNKTLIELYQPAILFKDYVLWKLQVLTPSVLIRKSILVADSKSLFDEKITRGQETEFFSRVFFKMDSSKYKIANVPLFLYRQHRDTKTNHNTTYIKTFKSSQTFIAIENLRRSIELEDNELVVYFSRSIISMFFRAVENKHDENSIYILKQFTPLLQSKYFKAGILFKIAGTFFHLTDRGSYRVEKYLKNSI